jgi:FkbM family methyltransferase
MTRGTIDKALLADFLPEEPIIVDAGAHIGVDSAEMAERWPTARIHAIEPVPQLFKKLQEHCAPYSSIVVHQVALSTKDGMSTMHVSSGVSDASSSLHKPKEHLERHPQVVFETSITVKTQTLDSFMRVNNLSYIDLLWMDLQGHEYDVLRTTPEVLSRIGAIYTEVSLVELYEGAGSYSQLRALLEQNNFIVVQEYLAWEEAGNVLFVQRDIYEQSLLPISAVVAGHEEGALLSECLQSLYFCTERLFIDMESTDGSADIARSHSALVLPHKRVEIVEEVREWGASHTAQEWVLFLDPDERILHPLLADIREHLTKDVGLVSVPCVFHVGEYALRGTVWGSRARPLIIHKDRASINRRVHGGYSVKKPYKTIVIQSRGDNYVEHLWLRSLGEFMPKHLRYIAREGEARYARGERASWRSFIYRPVVAFWECFVTKKGYLDGMLGLILSLLYGWYILGCYRSLLRYEQQMRMV